MLGYALRSLLPPLTYVKALRQRCYSLSTATVARRHFLRQVVTLRAQAARRRVGISLEDRAESLFQRLQKLVVALPFVGRSAIDRLAHLLGACSPHGAVGLVKGEASRLEGQPAKVEQRANLRFRVVDHPFVDDAMDPPREHVV